MLTAAPLTQAGPLYRLEGGAESRWVVQSRSATSNGLPTGGTATRLAGLGVSDASLPFDGVLTHGRAFDTGHSIWVNDSIFIPPGGEEYPSGQVDVDGPVDENGIVHFNRLSSGPAAMSGLGVTVEYYAAGTTATLRTLAGFTNGGDAPVSATVTFVYNLGSDGATSIAGTSSNDRTFDADDRWIVTDDVPPSAGNDAPAVTAVIRGPGASGAGLPSVSNVVYDAGGTQGVLVNYSITVPAHSTRYLMYFTQMSLTSAGALAAARTFDTPAPGANADFWSDALSGMTQEQLAQVLNWSSNSPPVASADTFVTDEDTPLHVDGPGVLTNDADPDGNDITAVLVSGPANGTVEFRADGSFDYVPAANFFGTGAAADGFTYMARDTAGALSDATTVTIEVNPVNDAPTADAGGDAAAEEGAAVTFSGSGADVDGDALSYHWDFSDDTSADGADATHAYADDGEYTATLTVSDGFGGTASSTRTVTVGNVAPTVAVTGSPDGDGVEGALLTFGSTVTDPAGDNDPIVYAWSVTKDGEAYALESDLSSPGFAFTPSDNGTYVVTLAVGDGDRGTATDSRTVVVANVAPTASIAGAPPQAPEGAEVSLGGFVIDPGSADTHTYQWTVTRKVAVAIDPVVEYDLVRTDDSLALDDAMPDGQIPLEDYEVDVYTPDDTGGGDSVDYPLVTSGTGPGFSFTPEDDGEYIVTLTVTDDDGGVGIDSRVISVVNVAPTAVGLALDPYAVAEGGTVHLSGGFSDPGTADVFTVRVDWGDGSPAQYLDLPAGASSFVAEHRYLDDRADALHDVYPVTVTVTDDDGGAGSASTDAAVANAAPVAGTVNGPASGLTGQPLTYFAGFADAGTLDTHTATIDWGDGSDPTPAAVIESSGSGTASGSHAYPATGTYTVTFTVADDDGGTHAVSRTVTVAAVSLQGDTLYVAGTAGNDVISLSPSSVAGRVDVVVNGVNLGAYAPGRFVIYAGAGDDTVHGAGAVTTKAWIYGEEGNDTLNIGNGGGIVFGGPGNDQVNGGSGREILIGGEGADRVVGNPGDDILMTSITKFDNRFSTATHEQAWNAIYAEWANTSRTFRQRVDNLRDGSGRHSDGTLTARLNGSFFLNDSTVDDDSAADVLGTYDQITGASGEDWFIYKAGEDKVSSMSSLEASEDLTIQ